LHKSDRCERQPIGAVVIMARRRTLAEELAELATPQPAAGKSDTLRARLRLCTYGYFNLTCVTCFVEADFEADELADGPTLEDVDFDMEQEQQPARSAQWSVELTLTNELLHRPLPHWTVSLQESQGEAEQTAC